MSFFRSNNFLLLSLSVLLLLSGFSCSGGGTIFAGGGIDGTGIISRGVITAFGSIWINGNKFDTGQALVIVDGAEAGTGDNAIRDNLDVGRLVTIEGSIAPDDVTYIADRVIYSSNVKGPVQSITGIDSRTKEIIVLGQPVIVNVNTSFKDTGFYTISLNDVVEVSGLFDDTGTIWATFMHRTGVFTSGLEVEVAGYLTNLDAEHMTFEVNNLEVDYHLTAPNSLPAEKLLEGILVQVAGTLAENERVLLASEITIDSGLDAKNAAYVEITGFVTGLVSSAEFTVGDLLVIVEPEAVYVDGGEMDIIPGVKLEVEGSLINGILYAWQIEFWATDQVEVEDIVNAVASPAEFTIGNLVILTTEDTVFEGGSPDDIDLGRQIEVKGVPVDVEHSIIIADKVSLE